MTVLEFVEKVKSTFGFEREIDVRIYHREYGKFTLTYSELISDVADYSSWEIETYKNGDAEITFNKEED